MPVNLRISVFPRVVITVKNLHKTLGTQQILRGIDLEIRTGETCVILGRSGGGKSVLLKHFVGLMKPTRGEVWIDQENITNLPERQTRRDPQESGDPLPKRRTF